MKWETTNIYHVNIAKVNTKLLNLIWEGGTIFFQKGNESYKEDQMKELNPL